MVTAHELKRARGMDVARVGNIFKVDGAHESPQLVRDKEGTWVCTCPEDYPCVHVLAVRLKGGGDNALVNKNPVISDTHGSRGSDTGTSTTSTPVSVRLTVEDPRLYANDNRGLPGWLTNLRSHQQDAVLEIDNAFKSDADVVFVEAPTGSGKTVIGELSRRLTGTFGMYVCSGLDLQTQFAKDFQYANTVRGRSNYPTLMPGSFPEITAADCDKERVGEDGEYKCTWCGSETFNCPYEIAKQEAVRGKLANVNTTYALTEWNYVGGFSGREVVIVDEADLLEGEVMSFVEFNIGPRAVRELNLQVPGKGVHATTIEKWLRDEVLPAARAKLASVSKQSKSQQTVRTKKMYAGLVSDIGRVLTAGINFGDAADGGWVRVYESRSKGRDDTQDRFTLKPVKVGDVARKVLWPHGVRWVLMSATLVSVDELVDSLGLRDLEIPERDDTGAVVGTRPARWEEVHVGSTFPVENRAIVASGVANMTRKGQDAGGVDDLLWGIGVVLREHAGENVLIHTHTYALAKQVVERYRRSSELGDRKIWTYTSGGERGDSLAGFKKHGGVLIAPSMDRGIDLPGDECRVQVICKLPMPYLGDAQIGARLKTRGGELWYAAQTARGLIQMTGRAVRSESDWATTYVLDRTFGSWKKRNKGLLPSWWQDAVTYIPARQFEDEVRKRAEEHGQR